MKNVFLKTLLAVFLFVSCNKNELPDTFKIGFEEEFQHGEINLTNDNSLNFSIIEINDSRCPSDVTCIWEGKVDVKIEIKSPQKGNIILSTHNNRIDTFDVYSFELIDVSPYPITTETIELKDYKVTLKIEEIQF